MSIEELERLGAGREAEVFAWDEGRVLRLARDPARRRMVEREALALQAAQAAGAPVPRVHELVDVDGRPGLVLDRVDGVDLLVRLGRRPWTLWPVARTLGAQHAALHRVEAPEGLPPLREDLRRRLASDLVPDDVRRRARERLELLPDGDRLLHGDFHPGNVLRTSGSDIVIDWTNGTRGDPAADVARSLLLVGHGDVPDGAPTAVRLLAPVARRLLATGYLRSYARRRPLDRELVGRWWPVWAAARLAEDIEAERDYLLFQAR